MKKLRLFLFLPLFLVYSHLSFATIINVNVTDFAFTPVSFDVAVGDTIRWTLVSGTHTTTSTSVPLGAATWDYTFTGVGDTFDYVVAVAGVYEYYCAFHPITMKASFSTEVPLPFIENFDFTAGDNLTIHGWVAHSAGGTNPITINNGGLTFTGYPSSGIGNAALVDNTSEDIHRLFANVTSGAVYTSFLVNVVNNPVGYFIHLAPNPHNTFDFRARVWVKGTAPALSFALSYASSDTIVTAPVYSLNTTYLVVVKYEVVPGDLNDVVSLYVFSESDPYPTIEPTPTLGPLANATTSADIIPGSINLRQYSSSQNFIVDGLRIGTAWGDVVPVELTSFKANTVDGNVKLDWTTATELNNSGFEIERKSANTNWQKIAFVAGNGTTTQPRSYSYVDNTVTSGKYSYRLKQIDYDGSYAYSKSVEVEVTKLVSFALSQNYPNPFNPSTTIEYSVKERTNVKITVMNAIGQEVAEVVNEIREPGSYKADFKASNMPSGVYFYKMEAGSFVQTRKMILIK